MPSRILLLASSVLVLASAANASDLAAPANDWTGVYVGFGLGGGFGDADLSASGSGSYSDLLSYNPDLDDQPDDGADNLPPEEGNDGYRQVEEFVSAGTVTGLIACYLEPDYPACSGNAGSNASASGDAGEFGLLGRGEIGADYQMERIVMGLNASYTLSDRSMSVRGSGGGDATFLEEAGDARGVNDIDTIGEGSGQVQSSLDLGNSWSVGGRIGYLLSDNTLLFGSGGYTQMKAKLKSRFSGSAGAGYDDVSDITTSYGISAEHDISSSTSEWLNGYYLGAGVETMLFENFSLKFEYRFADYGDIETSAAAGNLDTCQGTCWSAGVESEADITDHSLMATVSFRM